MRALELKVPPVALLLATGAAMAALAWALPVARFRFPGRVPVAALVALAGLGLCAAGVASFKRARTTVNPLTPDAASALVETGVYAHTRNPMYLGFAVVAFAWGVALASAASLALVPLFVLYLDRWQIVPEERALAARFGVAFEAYAARVGRWL